MADRSASATWQGDLFEGKGTVSADSSGLFTDAPVSWPARVEAPEGQTSPEELLAGAHAACFAMSMSLAFGNRKVVADEIGVTGTATFVPGKGITTIALAVTASGPGIDDALLADAVAEAERDCPVSGALRGNVDVQVSASLA